ncbi:MAG: ABC transporter substrate-binding protein [Alphaproteobacteria bacterium]|nr:ABC transporter substrate-binding protein [Alphaproteobacteria bacterium]MBV8409951.1 ABC transporter substrate-binding protein [Alphaproteobacteria bacterium]
MGSAALAATARTVSAKAYDTGASDSEIKLGSSAPYSGPASAYGLYGTCQTAYFKMLNEQGGINGRKVTVISLDNAFSPPKALEVTRQLVEGDKVLAIAGTLGTAANTSMQKYLNDRKVPNLFLTSGAERFNDPKHFPWIVPLYPTYVGQGEIFGKYILAKHAGAKVGVLYVNDDLGKDFLKGLKKGLGERGTIAREVSHEFTDPSVDNQIIDLKGSGADVLVQLTYAKFAAQGMRKAYELGWRPAAQILASVASSISGGLVPAGIAASKGIITARWEKLPNDPQTAKDPDVVDYIAFCKKYMPGVNVEDNTPVAAYINSFLIARVLGACGDELTRENVLKQATGLKNMAVPMLMSGITVTNSPDDYLAFHALQLCQFDGEKLAPLGELISFSSST